MELKKALLASALVAASTCASALPLLGEVSFAGNDATASWNKTDSNITFSTVTNAAGDDVNAVVTTVAGDFTDYFAPFSLLGSGSTARFFDFEYDADFTAGKLWESRDIVGPDTGDMIEFHLSSLESADLNTQGVDSLTIKGQGFLKNADTGDIADVVALFTFTANGDSTFSWSSTTAVPEPGSLALLGLGLAGLGIARRKQK